MRVWKRLDMGSRIGVVSDLHGCLVGLRAALRWLGEAGVDRIVCAGDVASFGPQPNACIALLAKRRIPTVQGNCDRDLLLPVSIPVDADVRARQLLTVAAWSRARLTPESRAWLAALPPELAPLPGMLVVHGAPGDPEAIVTAAADPDFPPPTEVIAAGHLHAPFVRRMAQGLWVNAGSAGRPCDGDPRAAVAILEQRVGGWDATIHRVFFDLDAAAQAIRAAGMPHVERMIETQVQACWW